MACRCLPTAQPPGAVAAVVDALGDIARGQKAAPAAAQSGAPQPSPAASSDPAAIPAAACGAVQETDAGEGHGRDAEPRLAATVIAAQVLESAPGAARRATRRAVTADPADPAAAGQLPPGLLLHAAPIAGTVANAHAAARDARPWPAGSPAGHAAEQPAASAMTPAVAAGLRGRHGGAGPRPGK